MADAMDMMTSAPARPGARAVVLLSGGLDSSTTIAMAAELGYDLYALSFRYGQRHARELEAAQAIGRHFGVREHKVADIDLRMFGGSALTSDAIEVPLGRDAAEMGTGIPSTYVPGRNLIFLSFATAYAEVVGADDIFLGINALDYSVSGDSQIWVRSKKWARLMPIQDFWKLPEDQYETIAVDPQTLSIVWRRVIGRFRHESGWKRCYRIRLERGQEITITEDHSLFTLDAATAQIATIQGSSIRQGTPLVVPFDLSTCTDAWLDDLTFLDLTTMAPQRKGLTRTSSVILSDGHFTHRHGKTRIPKVFPVTDDFLYIVGLWLAEGGTSESSNDSALRFSIGGIPGAVETLRRFFGSFGVSVGKSPANDFDYAISSSVFDALFHHLGMFGTAQLGEKRFPTFFWDLSQRQRRIVVSGLWDGGGCHVSNGEALFAQKSHQLVTDLYHSLVLDGMFPVIREGEHEQLLLSLGRVRDMLTFSTLYPLRHSSTLASVIVAGSETGKDETTGLWEYEGVPNAIATATLPAGLKTARHNSSGECDERVRAQRSAFIEVPVLRDLARSKLAFPRVVDIQEVSESHMYDLSVEGAENFIANGVLAHNSGYPDCRPEFLEAFARTANLATKAGTEDGRALRYHAPLIRMTKAEIVREGTRLHVPWELTWSCYLGGEKACGRCDSCQLRLKGFAEAGLNDPLPYAE